MLSRTAENLFWLSRYMERAENLARILDIAARMANLPSAYAGASNEWESALATASALDTFYDAYDAPTRDNVIAFILTSPQNPNSIKACIEMCRTNARSARATITTQMWETINEAWYAIKHINLNNMNGDELLRFLHFVEDTSMKFDSAAYRTMLRTDHYWFQRLGTLIERADNTARLLDVKYHLLLPENETVGGGLDYFQWSSLLRSVSGLASFHLLYKQSLKPWLVADFLILRPEQPRSLIAIYESINRFLAQIAETYGRQGESQRAARCCYAHLQNLEISTLFQNGLHEFITHFIDSNNKLGHSIATQYLV